jgi:hypothetical protein
MQYFSKDQKKITYTCVLQQEYTLKVKTYIVKSVYCTTAQIANLTEFLLKVKFAQPQSEGLSGIQWPILRMLRTTHNCAYIILTAVLLKGNSAALLL